MISWAEVKSDGNTKSFGSKLDGTILVVTGARKRDVVHVECRGPYIGDTSQKKCFAKYVLTYM